MDLKCLAILFLSLPGATLAQEGPLPARGQAIQVNQSSPLYPHLPGVECYCTDREGARVEMGELRCLDVDGRQFTAQCQMSLNVPMWREVAKTCVGM